MGAANVVRMPRQGDRDASRIRGYEQAFGSSRRNRRDTPRLTLALASEISTRIMDRFQQGLYHNGMPALQGHVRRTPREVSTLQPWCPGHGKFDEGSFYVMGLSLAYEYDGAADGEAASIYQMRVRLFGKNDVITAKKNETFQSFIRWFGDLLAAILQEDDIKELMPEAQRNPDPPWTGQDLVRWFEITGHTVPRHPDAPKDMRRSGGNLRLGDSIRHCDADDNDGVGIVSLFCRHDEKVCGLSAAHVLTLCGTKPVNTHILSVPQGKENQRIVGSYIHPDRVPFENEKRAPLDAALFDLATWENCAGNFIKLTSSRRLKIDHSRDVTHSPDDNRPLVLVVGREQRLMQARVAGVRAIAPVVSSEGDIYIYRDVLELDLPKDRYIPNLPETTKARSLTKPGESGATVMSIDVTPETKEIKAGFAGIVIGGNSKDGQGALSYALDASSILEGLNIELAE